ncbi:MAG: radical SAM protein [Deltaproteobacteria bacterium]|nr:radical SAM protein [Deltaproteobacteria bacterium]
MMKKCLMGWTPIKPIDVPKIYHYSNSMLTFKAYQAPLKHLPLIAKKVIYSYKYRIKKKFHLVEKPHYINFITTNKCNSRCVMCDIWKIYKIDDNKPKIKDELTFSNIEHFFIQNYDFLSHLKNVGLTGGEAFLRPDIADIVLLIHRLYPRIGLGIQTHGLMPELIRDRITYILKYFPNFGLAVSMDGVGDMHAKIRGISNACEKATRTIRYAKELGVKSITCGMTLTKENYHQIPEVKEYVESMGCEFSCFLAETSDYFYNSTSQYALNAQDLQKISQLLEPMDYHYFMSNLRLRIMGKRRSSLPCYAGYMQIVIDPYGNIKPCILRPQGTEGDEDVMGNIKQQSLYEILYNHKSNALRRKIEKCRCWCQCEVSTSAIIDPVDTVKWFARHSSQKKEFLKILGVKVHKI